MNLLIIGSGKMGLSHAALFNSINIVDNVYIYDTNKFLLSLLSKYTGLFPVSGDINEFLESGVLDGVIIATPTKYHYLYAKMTVNCGLPCFIEKPITDKFEKTQELRNLAHEKNVLLFSGYVNRFNPLFNFAKEIITSGLLGTTINYYNRMCGAVTTSKNYKKKQSSALNLSAMSEYGSHAINLSLFLFGHPKQIISISKQNLFNTTVDDISQISILHSNNINGTVSVNWSDHTQRKAFNSIELWGEYGYMKVTKQTLKVYSEISLTLSKPIRKGWNQFFAPEILKSSQYYLRGEDYYLQTKKFVNLISAGSGFNFEFDDALITDEILNFFHNNTAGKTYENISW